MISDQDARRSQVLADTAPPFTTTQTDLVLRHLPTEGWFRLTVVRELDFSSSRQREARAA